MSDYKPVPVEEACSISERYGKSIVIVLSYDQGVIHTTTYGVDPQHKAWAASGGEIAARTLGALPMHAVFEDYRLDQARKLLTALKEARESVALQHRNQWDSIITEAEKFL